MRLLPLLAALVSLLPTAALAEVRSLGPAMGRDVVGGIQHDVPPPARQQLRVPVRLDAAALLAADGADLFQLPSTGWLPLYAHDVDVRRRDDGLYVWTGRVDTRFGPQTAVLTVRIGGVENAGAIAFGLIPQQDGPPLRLETRRGRMSLIEGPQSLPDFAVDEPDFRRPPAPDAPARELRRRQDEAKAAGDPVIDVLVVYTPALVQVWGSNAAVLTRIAHLEEITNQAYVDSDVGQSIRVVGTQLVDYTINNDNDDALDAITGSIVGGSESLPLRQEVIRLRELYGADLVKLMRNFDRSTQNSCGVGWLGGWSGNPFTPEWGFSVTSDHGFSNDNCGEWTYAHELGHNMGAHHDVETADGEEGAYPYSHGLRQTLSPTSGFATIMAYTVAPQVRIGRFSNPRQDECLGQPCGDAATADNARGLNQSKAAVAAFVAANPTSGPPALSVSDVTVTEGNSGQKNARFTFTLSAPATAAVSISTTTMHGDAIGADYVAQTATLIIPIGQTSGALDVKVRGDTSPERDEVFAMNILSASNARIVDGQGVGTIVNDEATPTLSIADVSLDEGDAGTTSATFVISLTAPSTGAVTFDFHTHEYAAGPTAATAGVDYTLVEQTTVTIPAGQTSVQVFVPVAGDTTVEEEERFYVMINNVVGAVVGDVIATGRIRNDDGGAVQPTLTVADAQVNEGDSGTTALTFTVSLSAPAPSTVSFSATSSNGTAVAGSDYDALSASNLTISTGQSGTTVTVLVRGDTLDESDENLTLELANLAGATAGDVQATGVIVDDDGGPAPAFAVRDDRRVILENSGNTAIPVLANDVYAVERLVGGSLTLTVPPSRGTASVDSRGTADIGDDRLLYRPTANTGGDDVIAYRLCEGAGRCAEGVVDLVVRPHADLELVTDTGAGWIDVEMKGLRALPGAVFSASDGWLVTPLEFALAADPTPETPWDLGRTGTATHVAPSGGRPILDALSLGGGNVDLYVGVDTNGNGVADPAELRCTSATSADNERCEIDLTSAAAPPANYWVMLHARTGTPNARLYVAPLLPEAGDWGEPRLRATGPGQLAAGATFPMRVLWNSPDQLTTQRTYAYVLLQADAAAAPSLIPVRIDRPAIASTPRATNSLDSSVTLALAPGGIQDRLYIDVPPSASRLVVQTYAFDGGINLVLRRAADSGTPPHIAPAPATGAEEFRFDDLRIPGQVQITLPTPGRWYVVIENRSAHAHAVGVRARTDNTASPPRFGSYFNPDRGGHGLLLYPADDQWAGLWYTYLQDGSPTWYYLQDYAPNGTGTWEAGIYRAAWDGDSNYLVKVGHAVLTPTTTADVFDFSYRLDGEAGSERMHPLGRGCPTLSGAPLDVSSHWFNPARAGTGYSVQMWSNYEFYAAFVYDGRGVPRFLTAESGSFAGADAVLQLDQLRGFCPLCTRTGNPQRFDVGDLRRRFAGGSFAEIELDAIWTDGVPGAWTADEAIQLLGGPGTTQGCQP